MTSRAEVMLNTAALHIRDTTTSVLSANLNAHGALEWKAIHEAVMTSVPDLLPCIDAATITARTVNAACKTEACSAQTGKEAWGVGAR